VFIGAGNALVNGSANISAVGQKVRYSNPFAAASLTCTSCPILLWLISLLFMGYNSHCTLAVSEDLG